MTRKRIEGIDHEAMKQGYMAMATINQEISNTYESFELNEYLEMEESMYE